jgi:hypothetical protein
MAILWLNSDGNDWVASELSCAARITGSRVEPLQADPPAQIDSSEPARDVLLLPEHSDRPATKWILLAPIGAGICVNETRFDTGIRVLADRDAIRWPGTSTIYFSTERLARIEAYPGAEPVACARCKLEITHGEQSVCCPTCGVWMHERLTDGRTCFTYSDKCALCDQSTELDTPEYRWRPERL